MSAPLLVIGHEATLTGGPRVLLDLLRYAKPDLPVPLAIQLMAEGPLSAELRSLADVDRLISRPMAIIVNGAAAADELLLHPPETPALAYVHEEGDALRVLPPSAVTALTDRCDRVLCVSERARRQLGELGVQAARLSILPPVVGHTSPADDTTDSVFGDIGIDPTEPFVLACGEAGWRKGADLFVDVARRVVERTDVRFVWVGRRPRAFGRVLDNDTDAAGLRDRLLWIGERRDVANLFTAAQLLLMTSREDPQPLVPLEAALCGTATAGFAIGGVADLGAASAACTVPYPDTPALADAVVDLLSDRGRASSLAAAAAERARTHHSVEQLGPRFLLEVRALLEAVSA